jgi:hypothetical protein
MSRAILPLLGTLWPSIRLLGSNPLVCRWKPWLVLCHWAWLEGANGLFGQVGFAIYVTPPPPPQRKERGGKKRGQVLRGKDNTTNIQYNPFFFFARFLYMVQICSQKKDIWIFHFGNSQNWLNMFMEECHLGYMTKV